MCGKRLRTSLVVLVASLLLLSLSLQGQSSGNPFLEPGEMTDKELVTELENILIEVMSENENLRNENRELKSLNNLIVISRDEWKRLYQEAESARIEAESDNSELVVLSTNLNEELAIEQQFKWVEFVAGVGTGIAGDRLFDFIYHAIVGK